MRLSDWLNWLRLARQYIAMTRNNLCIISISLAVAFILWKSNILKNTFWNNLLTFTPLPFFWQRININYQGYFLHVVVTKLYYAFFFSIVIDGLPKYAWCSYKNQKSQWIEILFENWFFLACICKKLVFFLVILYLNLLFFSIVK